jgi:hypothetical protein
VRIAPSLGYQWAERQTLNIAIPNLAKFAYVGVYSSGVLGIVRVSRA